MGLGRIVHFMLLAASITGCAAGNKGIKQVTLPVPNEKTGCTASYDQENLLFRCGRIQYDLFGTPVRQERVYDILRDKAITRRHYMTELDGKTYVFRTEQVSDEKYPEKILLETPKGFMRIKLNKEGRVSSAIAENRYMDL